MGMTPYDFFDGFVVDDYDDWKETPHSIRKAFHAAVSSFHMADHYYRYHARRNQVFAQRYKTLTDFQKAVTTRTPSFRDIQDMATAFKHLYTRATCSIASGGSIESVTYRGDTIEGDWQQAEGGWTGGVIIRRRDKSIVRFDQAIEAVIEMWRTFIYAEAPALDLTADGPPANSPGLSGETS